MEKVHKNILKAGIVLFWVVMVALLYQKHYGPIWKGSSHAVLPDPEFISGEDRERWMGLYFKGEKIGYAHISKKKVKDGYIMNEKVSMRLNVMGVQQKIDTVTEASLGIDYRLNSFNFRMASDITSFDIKGEVKGKKMKLTVSTTGDKRDEEIVLKDKPYLNLGLIEKFVQEGLTPGKNFRAMIFDPSTMSQQELEIEVEGKEKIRIMGVEKEAYRLKVNFKGMNILSWVDENGETLKEESPLGLVLVKESEKEALGLGPVVKADIIAETMVIPNIILKEPEKLTYLKLRLKDINLQGMYLSGGRQLLNGDVLEIKKEDPIKIRSIILPIREKDFRESLSQTSLIQSKDQRIIEKAKELIREEKDALKASRLLMEWVYRNIEKRPTVSIPNALEVLRMRQGDCNEHTTLFTALARSAGIPTKMDIGLVYSKGGFYYHAWPEVFVGEWISLDPTLGQFPADVTHIRFLEGDLDKQVEILRIVGRISIEILEYRY